MHTEHPEVRRIAGVGATEAMKCGCNRSTDPRRERTEDLRCPRPARAAADDQHRALRALQCCNRRVERVRPGARPIARRDVLGNLVRPRRFQCAQDIGRQIDEHRARTRAGSKAKGGAQSRLDRFDRADHDVALGDLMGDRSDVDFLERVRAHHRRAHLAGERDKRNVVHHRVDDPGDQIGGTGARCRDAHAHTTGRARKAARSENRRSLMPYEHVHDTMIVKCVIQRHDRAARIAEHRFDSQALECIENDRCARARVHDEPPASKRGPAESGGASTSAFSLPFTQ